MRAATVAVVALMSVSCSQSQGGSKAIDKTDQNQTIAYSIGYDIGQNVGKQGSELNVDALVTGLRDGFSASPAQLSKEETAAALQEFRARMMAKQRPEAARPAQDPAQNKELGEKFLEMNRNQEGVKVTASGLQYKIETEGQGESPKATDTVKVHYRGTLVTGEEFDSSYSRGEPAQFPVNGVIAGWTEALQLMKPGAKWRLYIPSELAYGERGAGAKIGPNSALQFEVELLEVVR